MADGSVVMSHPVVETLLTHYRLQIGADLDTYRNHVYRGLNYQRRLLGRDEVSNDQALAWAVHDLGIWTAHTFDYLAPSAELARRHADEAEVADLPRVIEMVELHHKLRPVHDPLVETFRKADRIDVARGHLRSGLGSREIDEITAALPYCGFHRFLLREATRHITRHPLRPLPMFRW